MTQNAFVSWRTNKLKQEHYWHGLFVRVSENMWTTARKPYKLSLTLQWSSRGPLFSMQSGRTHLESRKRSRRADLSCVELGLRGWCPVTLCRKAALRCHLQLKLTQKISRASSLHCRQWLCNLVILSTYDTNARESKDADWRLNSLSFEKHIKQIESRSSRLYTVCMKCGKDKVHKSNVKSFEGQFKWFGRN